MNAASEEGNSFPNCTHNPASSQQVAISVRDKHELHDTIKTNPLIGARQRVRGTKFGWASLELLEPWRGKGRFSLAASQNGKMRLTFCQGVLVAAIALNLLVLYYVSKIQHHVIGRRRGPTPPSSLPFLGPLQPGITVLIREFEDFENYVPSTVESIWKKQPQVPILVVADHLPYPPLALPKPPSIQLITLKPSPLQPAYLFRPESHMKTEYVALVPDGVKMDSASQLEQMLEELKSHRGKAEMVAAPVQSLKPLRCLNLKVNLKEWTAVYTEAPPDSKLCTALRGEAVVLLRTKNLFNLSMPLARPLLTSLFIQTALRGWAVRILDTSFSVAQLPLFSSQHNQWKADNLAKTNQAQFFRDFGIKRVILEEGGEQWFGCSKETPRCFGSIHKDTPEYLHHDRWTPPCCLKALRETTRHVINILENAGVRYWLEGGTLLGAARYKDIIPWDYDVDLGFLRDDILKCELLRNAKDGSVVDEKGFVWEKAVEGEFYRVQYSEYNHLHVDLWPFYSHAGFMVKKTWTDHQQDMPFPEEFLDPLVPISFAGIIASAPNNYRSFLEMKFGPRAIENPEYPNPEVKSLKEEKHVKRPEKKGNSFRNLL